MSDIPLSVPVIRGNEWAYVKECLDTAWVSSLGGFVGRFERAVAEVAGRRHAVAVVNGTCALHVALQLAGVGPGDEVVVPALTFAAPAFAVKYRGAHPLFVDVEDEYLQLDVAKVADFLERECDTASGEARNRRTGRRVKAVLPVHILGHPVDMDPLLALAGRFGLAVIEDAAESIGAAYQGRPVGSFGQTACFSFNGNKVVTTGGGGMLVTDDEKLATRAKYLTTQAKDDPVEYFHQEIGYNYRLTNVLAAIGLAQMEMLPGYLGAKRRIAKRYEEALQAAPGVSLPKEADWAHSTYWLYTIRLGAPFPGRASRDLMRFLADRGIQSRPLWHPLHSLPPFSDCMAHEVEAADRAHEQCLSLPCSVDLTESQQERVVDCVLEFLRARI